MWGAIHSAPPAQVESVTPLQPTGSWLIEGEDNTCALSHAFGAGKREVTVAFRPWPLGDNVDLVVITQGSGLGVDQGTATVKLGSDGAVIRSPYAGYAIKDRSAHLTQFTLKDVTTDQIAAVSSITIAFDGRAPITVMPPDRAKAFAALTTCDHLLLQHLGVDPKMVAAEAKSPTPIGSPDQWFDNVYPGEALSAGSEGNTAMLLTINTEGRVTECVSFGSSGDPRLDSRACAVLKRVGMFHPAEDGNGKPITGYITEKVNWRLYGMAPLRR